MKKICSMMTMLAMMVAALSFTACSSSSSDDDEFGGSGGFGDGTLVVNGQTCNPNKNSFIDQKRKQIQISATYISDNNFWQSYEVGIRIVGRPFVISDLEVGEAFDFDELKIEEFRHGSTINLNEKEYRMLSGSITVESVNNKQVKLRFNDLTFELKVSTFFDNDYYPENPQKNVVTGTALFHNHLSSGGEWVPFY